MAAWISDETPTHFLVNVQLSKWTLDAAGVATGYTLQFTHQGIQFGVLAFYGGPTEGWQYGNGFVDVQTGELANVSDAEGTFTPGTPALLAVRFDKAHFPHADAADNRLVAFKGGTADFKPPFPFWVAEGVSGQDLPAEPAYLACDLVEGATAYTFQTGGHSMHGAPAATNGTAEDEPALANDTSSATPGGAGPAPTPEGSNETPAPTPLAGLGAAAAAALLARRRRA